MDIGGRSLEPEVALKCSLSFNCSTFNVVEPFGKSALFTCCVSVQSRWLPVAPSGSTCRKCSTSVRYGTDSDLDSERLFFFPFSFSVTMDG